MTKPQIIIKHYCKKNGIAVKHLKRRLKHIIAIKRNIILELVKQGYSYNRIGEEMGYADHTVVGYHIKKFKEILRNTKGL